MSRRNSSQTDKALRLVARGLSRYKAAKLTGINQSTIYRAFKRQALQALTKEQNK